MDFDFSSDQEMLRDAVQKWVQKTYTFEHYRVTVDQGGFSQDNWTGLNDLGLVGLAVPEQFGGLNMGPVEAMIVAEELGKGMVCEPWANAALMAVSILRDKASREIQEEYLAAIADGTSKVVLAINERSARYDLGFCTTTATEKNGQWFISGTKVNVPFGDKADHLIVAAKEDNGNISLFILPAKSNNVSTRSYCLQDGSRAGEIVICESPANLISRNGLTDLEHAVDIGTAALCAQAVGAMDQLLSITIDYMNTRKQFGVAIGTFQALRHRVADMKMQVELARSMSYFATLQLTNESEKRRYAVAAAKYQIGQSLRYVGQQAIQLHGGIAVTHEYIAGHYFKYLTTIELSLGDSNYQLGQVAQRMSNTAGVFEN
jgi:alkylation response protein AidB-like acyl-CoA dehydrogenase